MKARLTIEAGDARPEQLELEPTQAASLGRSRDNTVVLRSEHASRLHCKVFFEEGRWQIQDFGMNGTLVNGERVHQRANLEHGQEIRVGEIRLRFTLDGQSTSTHSARAISNDRKEWSSHSGLMTASRLHSADMSVLCAFMAAHVGCPDPLVLLRESLALLLSQSAAQATGYLSSDPADPIPKAVQPAGAGFDNVFSRHMTRRAQRDSKTIWLATELTESRPTDSLKEITDALCVPVRNAGVAVGMLHAIKKGDYFNERDVRFAEAMADFLAGCLSGLQLRHNLEMEVQRLKVRPPLMEELIGDSAPMVRLRQQIAQIAAQPLPALIRGEAGVPLDAVAVALHRSGPRAIGPFVSVPCTTIAPSMLESELFGPRSAGPAGEAWLPGYCALADEGSLHIDEVADLTIDAQARLLRLIEEKCYRPANGSADQRADVRVLAATQFDLETAASRNRFRKPLLAKLSQAVIDVPPLRTHLEDIPYLVQFFVDRLAVECRRQVTLTDAAMRKLQSYMWPGNHLQLRAELDAAVMRAVKDEIDEDDVLVGCESMLMVRR